MMEHLKPPLELDFTADDGTNVPEKWHQWRQTMELHIELSMDRKSEKDKCSAFLYMIVQKGRDVYNAMNLEDTQCDKIDVLFTKFKEYCKPKQNVTIERYHFNMRMQDKAEPIDQYITDLRLIAKNCSFGDLEDELIRDRIICGVNSNDVKQQLLKTKDLTLDKALTICRADEQFAHSIPVRGNRYRTCT